MPPSKKKQGTPKKTKKIVEDVSEEADDLASLDPIAAATVAKERKKRERAKALAVAAAKQAPADITTFFPDTPGRAVENKAFVTPASKSSPTMTTSSGSEDHSQVSVGSQSTSYDAKGDGVTAEQRSQNGSPPPVALANFRKRSRTQTDDEEIDDDINPLASLLGYRDDGSDSDSTDGDSPRKKGSDGADGPAESTQSQDAHDPMDAEFDNFMSDLQASGLLMEGGEEEADQKPPAEAVASGAGESSQAAAAPAASSDAALASEPSEGSLGTSWETEPSESAGPAEQRVLGDLDGCPGWHEVMDMASGKVYFWDSATNAVAWDPPVGSTPRTKEANAATFAEANDSATATGPQDGDEVESDAPTAEAMELPPTSEAHVSQALPLSGAPSTSQAPSAVTPPGSLSPEPLRLSQSATEDASVPGEAAGEAFDEAEDTGQLIPAPAIIPEPDHDVGHAADSLVTSVWSLAEAACGGTIPLIVRLAVEAEVRQRDWYIFASTQAEAASSGNAEGALAWPAYEQYMRTSVEALQGAAAEVAAGASLEIAPLPADVSDEVVDAMSLPYGPPSSSSEDGELEEGEVAPAKSERGESPVDMEVDATEDLPPLPVDEAALYSPTRSLSPLPEHAHPPLPSEPLAVNSSRPPLPEPIPPPMPEPALPPLPAEPAQPQPPLPTSNGYVLENVARVPEAAAEYMAAAFVVPATEPAPTPAVSAPVVKRKEYRAEPVYVAPVLSPEPPAIEPPLPIVDAPLLAESDRKKKRDRAAGAPSSKKKAKLAKDTSSLFNKWATVRKTLEEEDEKADEVLDADALERKRLEEAEEWRLQQLRAGTAAGNANFQPLAVDWREKVRLAQKRDAGAEAKEEAAPASTGEKAKPDLKALSEGLPDGWKAMWDKDSGEVFYGNPKTKQTTWDRPV